MFGPPLLARKTPIIRFVFKDAVRSSLALESYTIITQPYGRSCLHNAYVLSVAFRSLSYIAAVAMYKRAGKRAYKRSPYYGRPICSYARATGRYYVTPIRKPVGGLTNASPMFAPPKAEELGTKDVSGTATASTTGSLNLLFVPTRTGNTYEDRHGDATTIKSIRLRFTIKGGTTAVTNSYVQWVRCLLFWDNQPNGAVPAGNLPLVSLTVNSLTDPQYSYRFKILHDERFLITSSALGATNDNSDECSDFYKAKLNLVSNYSGNAGTIADLTTGALYLYVIGDTAAVTNENPVVTYYSRCRFIP